MTRKRKTDGSTTSFFLVMTPCFKGHGDSRYPLSKRKGVIGQGSVHFHVSGWEGTRKTSH